MPTQKIYQYHYTVTLEDSSTFPMVATSVGNLKDRLKQITKLKLTKLVIEYACIIDTKDDSFTYEEYKEEVL